MRKFVLPALLLLLTAASPPELARLRNEASRVTITRDDWGIAHVHGHTDADAVFGMIYAQAEDDFPRIEANYMTNLGLTAEADGEKAIWQDLRARLYVSEP
jgi:acyl-homoserine lactone acylase PvdQ